MQRSGAVGFGLEQGAQIEFQSDREQQQDDSAVRYLLQSREGGEAEDVQEEPRLLSSYQGRSSRLRFSSLSAMLRSIPLPVGE